ncbi:Eco57I restriction-modification methylase domain-containing protein [uncultured Haemophilus sp.]|uniref:Eco57I restriction-modification methylase domain-containing protein n=1 Tax=uncultured Haemophilus sp. TaxID=237779 RepID=UPI00280453EC|nr:Eco57I restriction-modification methylase domain-containing protein [uncultured Haemophilus sp.]
MKFDVIIGNPPYQLKDGGAQSSAKPVYQHFVEQAKKLKPNYICMITPSRWFSGGKGLDEFRDIMLEDLSIRQVHDYPDASECFPNVEIKGGVNYFIWNRDSKGDCLICTYKKNKLISKMERPLKEKDTDIFIRYNEAISIFRKVRNLSKESFSDLISSRKPFGLATNYKVKKSKDDNLIKLYKNRGIEYISQDEIVINKRWVNQHKVIIPYAIGSGEGKTDKVNPIYSEPNSACTETYIVIGPFENKKICDNVISYINTRFFHFMLTLRKNTQHATKGTYLYVPSQDFSKSWTDDELFAKYNLNDKEIKCIKEMIHPDD